MFTRPYDRLAEKWQISVSKTCILCLRSLKEAISFP